jgi:hypothetical protein
MAQKIVISLLVVTIVGALLIGIYDAARPSLASDALPEPQSETQPVVADLPAAIEPLTAAIDVIVTPTTATQPAEPVQQSLNMVGEPWSADVLITEINDFGMTLELADGSLVYVELGPPTYWQAQGVTLAVGDMVFVDGFYNGEQIHAARVLLPNGNEISLRNETGQPLWSGGASGGQGQSQVPMQIDPEAWITYTGTLTDVTNSSVILQTADDVMTLQLGQQRFWQDQGITLAVGDEVSVLGVWQGSQFQVAEVTKLQTGERIMLRDPNGRPLWAGPGNNAESTGKGQGGNGQGGQGSGQNANGQGGQGNGQGGNGGGGQGNGNGYRGGRAGN